MRLTISLAAAAIALSACSQPAELFVDQGYVRLPAVKGNPGVAYFTLHGGDADTKLLSVTAPTVIKTELHESMMNGSMASMTPIADLPVPAKAKLTFAPGGKHVMLFNINGSVKPGGTMKLIFTFSNNLRIEYDAPVIAAGDAAPKG
ncbi:MAG: copper chaperone PCu(A)C [Sphingomonas sp.]|nr:copper chaperone PCu(A)C [Sphingomonas sp.]